MRFIRLREVDSTSRHARRLFERGEVVSAADEASTLVSAERQTGGVGRHGRSWAWVDGAVACTLIVPVSREAPGFPPGGLGLSIGLACLELVREVLARGAGGRSGAWLKWPNDVLVGATDGSARPRKVLGILTEIVTAAAPRPRAILVGVGINANLRAADLPEEVRGSATTLQDHLGQPVDLDSLVSDLGRRLDGAVRGCLGEPGVSPKLRADALAALFGLGEAARFTMPDGTRIDGVLRGLDEDGRPQIQTADGSVIAPTAGELVIDPSAGSGAR